jgi:hypothetical protein
MAAGSALGAPGGVETVVVVLAPWLGAIDVLGAAPGTGERVVGAEVVVVVGPVLAPAPVVVC